MFQSGNFYFSHTAAWLSRDTRRDIGASEFNNGDTVSVKVDLDANTIAFTKNGADNGAAQEILHGSYFFAWDLRRRDEAVALLERK